MAGYLGYDTGRCGNLAANGVSLLSSIARRLSDELMVPVAPGIVRSPRTFSPFDSAEVKIPMAWRVARSVLVLFDQLNTLLPNRNKASDGTIGDKNHKPPSDHLPDEHGVVRAGDYTHDPAHGADMSVISEQLRMTRDARIKYVIFNHRMFSSYSTSQHPAWTWRPYTGTKNPHEHHMHVSVVSTLAADGTIPWEIGPDMTPNQEAVLYALFNMSPSVRLDTGHGVMKDFPNPFYNAHAALLAKIDKIAARVDLDPAELAAVEAAAKAGATSGASAPSALEIADAVLDEQAKRLVG
jgi:hypothetical protein